MKKQILYVLLTFALAFSGCAVPAKNTAVQVSTIDALLAGVYDGAVAYDQLLKDSNFGIGTFDGLDGEMVLFDGHLYQVRADGHVYHPDITTHTPFATVCRFVPDKTVPVDEGTTFESLKTFLDAQAPNQNLFYAIKLTGTFKQMKTRSVPGQQKPYPPLKVVTSNQPEFEMTNIAGTVVGFRCPPYVKGINVPGYHLHFISKDETQGGHILSFEVAEATCDVDLLDRYYLILPGDTEGFAETDLSRDRSRELEEVER
jgi:acetolactate decarboxylase